MAGAKHKVVYVCQFNPSEYDGSQVLKKNFVIVVAEE